MVANVAVNGSPSCLATRYGRRRSPTRAGRIERAANPMTPARNTVRNRVGPIGPSSCCHRNVRIQNVVGHEHQREQQQAADSRSGRDATHRARLAPRRNHPSRAIARSDTDAVRIRASMLWAGLRDELIHVTSLPRRSGLSSAAKAGPGEAHTIYQADHGRGPFLLRTVATPSTSR